MSVVLELQIFKSRFSTHVSSLSSLFSCFACKRGDVLLQLQNWADDSSIFFRFRNPVKVKKNSELTFQTNNSQIYLD